MMMMMLIMLLTFAGVEAAFSTLNNNNLAVFVGSPTATLTTYYISRRRRRRCGIGIFGGGVGTRISTSRHVLSDVNLHDESSSSSSSFASSSFASSSTAVSFTHVNVLPSPVIVDGWHSSTPLQSDIADWLARTTTTTHIVTMKNQLTIQSKSSATLPSVLISSSENNYRPLTQTEISLLQKAFSSYYDRSPNKDVVQSKKMLGECINIWTSTYQSGDEIAALYRVRADVNMELGLPREAEADYTSSIRYLNGEDGYKADADELPTSHLGRARAVRSQMMQLSTKGDITVTQMMQASKDYEAYFTATSRVDDSIEDDEVGVDAGNDKREKVSSKRVSSTINNDDVDAKLFSSIIKDGIQRNPYAAWEWGMIYRSLHMYNEAAEVHHLAALVFEEIGDNARSVICALDRGIDMASGLAEGRNSMKLSMVKRVLENAISSDVDVGGRDVELLQRLVAKEGEARVVLAGVLWSLDDSSGSKAAAESQFGTACTRLDELNADYRARMGKKLTSSNNVKTPRMSSAGGAVGYSIDDIVGADEASCSRFKNDKFIEDKLVWNDGLRILVKKFISLSR